MDTVILNNGVEMPLLGIGTSMMEEARCEEIVSCALEMGYRFIDTAQSYRNESAVGRAVRQSGVSRKDVFIATKLTVNNATYERARESCLRSLDRLGTHYIDLLLLQYPYNDVFGAWRALQELLEEGLVQAVGVCNFSGDRLADLLIHAGTRPQVVQIERHPYYQRRTLMAYLRGQDIQPVARAPFAGGKLGVRMDPVILEIAQAHEKSPEQVLLRWQIEQGVAVLPLPADAGQLAQDIAVFDFALSEEELTRIDALDEDKSALPECMTTPEWVEKICRQ